MRLTAAKWCNMRRRFGLVVAVAALASCVDDASPARKAEPAAAPVNVRIDALGGASPDQARLLAVLIRQNMDVSPAHTIVGAVDAATSAGGTYAVVVVDLKDADGTRLHRIVEDETIDRPDGTLTQADVARLADRLSAKLAGWRGAAAMDFALDDRPLDAPSFDLATGSIRRDVHERAASAKLRFDIAMGPAPGDGTQALPRALAAALARRAPSADWGCGCYRLTGEVALASTEGGRVALSIGWLVASDEGRPIGKVTQAKALDPARIAGHWKEIADEAAETAADGVLAVVLPAGGD